MIRDILEEVHAKTQPEIEAKFQLTSEQYTSILHDFSNKIFDEANQLLEEKNLLELKAMFDGASDEEKKAFLEDKKAAIAAEITANHPVDVVQATEMGEIAIPVFIEVAKEKLLKGKKPGLMEIPKILSFIKSRGAKVDGGGLFGGLFG